MKADWHALIIIIFLSFLKITWPSRNTGREYNFYNFLFDRAKRRIREGIGDYWGGLAARKEDGSYS